MPTYEYRCGDCGREFELFQRMSDEPGAPCPECGSRAERLISAGAGLLFKGEGFYITDYRSDAYRERAREESGNGAGGDGGKAKPKAGEETTGGGEKRSGTRGGSESAGKAEKAAGSTDCE